MKEYPSNAAIEESIQRNMIYRSLEQMKTPRDGATVRMNKWWLLHPKKGAAFYQSINAPQFHELEWYAKNWALKFPGHEAKFIPLAYI